MATQESHPIDPAQHSKRGRTKIYVGTLAALVILLAVAGTWRWTGAWLYTLTLVLYMGAYVVLLRKRNPELLERRWQINLPGTKSFDRPFFLVWRGMGIAQWVVAGLDIRFGWSHMPDAWMWWAFGITVVFNQIGIWPILVNPWFDLNVRVRPEEGQTVFSGGPYRYVRHPGYAFALPGMLMTPLLLQSWWAVIPEVMIIGAFVVRTALEDRALHNELPGYADYAKQVRWRLVPGVW